MIPLPRIYVSVPIDQHLSSRQLEFKRAIIDAIGKKGFAPQEFGVSGLPMKMGWTFDSAVEVMRQCQGAAVLAFARWLMADRGSVIAVDAQGNPLIKHGGTIHPAPGEGNHFEGALAISSGMPTLIVSDEGISNRGIVYRGGGRYILYIPTQAGIDWLQQSLFKPHFEAWCESIRDLPHVFLGYCSAAQSTADAIIKFLTKSLGLNVKDWAVDFEAGGTILDEIEKAAQTCRAGIFLFTKDDPLEGNPKFASPRDNVLFEAGYFMRAKSKERTLIISEQGTKMPADIGGNIYLTLKDRLDVSPVETKLRLFLEERL